MGKVSCPRTQQQKLGCRWIWMTCASPWTNATLSSAQLWVFSYSTRSSRRWDDHGLHYLEVAIFCFSKLPWPFARFACDTRHRTKQGKQLTRTCNCESVHVASCLQRQSMIDHLHFLCLVSHHHLSWHPSLAPSRHLGQRLPVGLPLVSRQWPCCHMIHVWNQRLGWHQPPSAVRLTLAPHLQSAGRLTPAPSVAWLTPVLSAIQPTAAPPPSLHVETCLATRLKSVIRLTPAPSAIRPTLAPLIESVVWFSSAPSAAPPSPCPCLQSDSPTLVWTPEVLVCVAGLVPYPQPSLGTVMVCSLIIPCFILTVSFPFVFSASCSFLLIFFVPRFSCQQFCIKNPCGQGMSTLCLKSWSEKGAPSVQFIDR